MSALPADICNQALDAIGSEVTLGDILDGSREAQVLLRAYGECLRQLLRSANWNFALRIAPLTLLADATGQTAYAGSLVPQGFIYEYAYPLDCMRAISVEWSPVLVNAPIIPLSTAFGAPQVGNQLRRAKFLVMGDINYPLAPGQSLDVSGVSPGPRLVLLTNAKNAQIKYTGFTPYPGLWDSLFRAAFVAYLAAEVALPLTKDKRMGMALRRDQYQIAKTKVMEARVADGNEQPESSDIKVDWIAARYSGGSRRGAENDCDGVGYFSMPYGGDWY